MKKFYIFFLFIALFFFSNFVYADTYNYTIDDSNTALINDEMFSILENGKKLNSSNLPYYIFWYNKTQSSYSITFFNDVSGTNNTFTFSGSNITSNIDISSYFTYNYSTSSFDKTNISSITVSIKLNNNYIDLSSIIDTNYPFKVYTFNHIYNLTYSDCSFSFTTNDNMPTLLSFYNSCGFVSNPHVDELNLLDSFYSLVIEKIIYLSDVFSSNYIYLSLFVVILIICLFEIVRRLL